MRDYIILTDSTVDLSPEMIEELELEVLPLTYTIRGKSYPDTEGEGISSHEFYDMLRAGEVATTSQVNMEAYKQKAEEFAKQGKDILYIGFSSGLSGSCNSARLALEELQEEYPEQTFIAIDSRSASMGQGLLVFHAVQNKRAGMSIQDNADWVLENRFHLAHWFTVDDLHFLKRGGRISGAAAFFGTMLSIKPVLHMDDPGHLIPMEKVRGRKASLDGLVRHMKEDAVNPGEQTIFISHGDCIEDAEYVAQRVREEFGTKDIRIHPVGTVIGSHSGPGTVALFYLGTKR